MVAMPQEMSTTLRLIWIKKRIGDYDFVENQDFVCVSQKNETQRAVRICGKPRLCDFFRKFGNPKSGTNLLKNQDFVKLNKIIERKNQ